MHTAGCRGQTRIVCHPTAEPKKVWKRLFEMRLPRHAKGVGAAAAAVVTPYYQRLNDEQLLAHFGAVANAVDLPILVYNIPQFTGTPITTPLLAQLAEENDNIVGVKDSVDSAI